MLESYHDETFELLFVLNARVLQAAQQRGLSRKQQRELINSLEETLTTEQSKINSLSISLEQLKSVYGTEIDNFRIGAPEMPAKPADTVIQERQQCVDTLKTLLSSVRVNNSGKPILPRKRIEKVVSELEKTHRMILRNARLDLVGTTQLCSREAEIIINAVKKNCSLTVKCTRSTTLSDLVEKQTQTEISRKKLQTLFLVKSNPKEAEHFIRKRIAAESPFLNHKELEERVAQEFIETKERSHKLHNLLEEHLTSSKANVDKTVAGLNKEELTYLVNARVNRLKNFVHLALDHVARSMAIYVESQYNAHEKPSFWSQLSKKNPFTEKGRPVIVHPFMQSQEQQPSAPYTTRIAKNEVGTHNGPSSIPTTALPQSTYIESAPGIPVTPQASQEPRHTPLQETQSGKATPAKLQEDFRTQSFILKKEQNISTSPNINPPEKLSRTDSGISISSIQSNESDYKAANHNPFAEALQEGKTKLRKVGIKEKPFTGDDLIAELKARIEKRSEKNPGKPTVSDSRKRMVTSDAKDSKQRETQGEKSGNPRTITTETTLELRKVGIKEKPFTGDDLIAELKARIEKRSEKNPGKPTVSDSRKRMVTSDAKDSKQRETQGEKSGNPRTITTETTLELRKVGIKEKPFTGDDLIAELKARIEKRSEKNPGKPTVSDSRKRMVTSDAKDSKQRETQGEKSGNPRTITTETTLESVSQRDPQK
ncbi:hypothetical protein NHE_0582 [Neorickettsia helminthoeca str. Oregon]|uniref:Uncharacterized protein n=1 Tax=Neorickettsia helminthoeca str. Oregon TaxID=1286528 RepID=X5HM63_9RICK|nr:hypothetical protein [Neorickettsia helminthoeca]AHX11520.1 hypothetical protein NHE_0582 [Neorickettsia helminthoeca str. Oregon]